MQFFAEDLMKTLKHGTLHEKLLVLAKSKGFDGFSHNPKHFFQLFAENMMKTLKYGSFGKIDKFGWFFTKAQLLFATF